MPVSWVTAQGQQCTGACRITTDKACEKQLEFALQDSTLQLLFLCTQFEEFLENHLDDCVAGLIVHLAHVLLQFVCNSCVVMVVTRHLITGIHASKSMPQNSHASHHAAFMMTMWSSRTSKKYPLQRVQF